MIPISLVKCGSYLFFPTDCKNICRKMLIDDVMKRATMAEVLECAWLKKVPKKNPDIARFSSSNIQANKPANTESTQKGQLILKCGKALD